MGCPAGLSTVHADPSEEWERGKTPAETAKSQTLGKLKCRPVAGGDMEDIWGIGPSVPTGRYVKIPLMEQKCWYWYRRVGNGSARNE